MTLKQFTEQKQVSGFETVSDLILNVLVGEERYQLDTDTSTLQMGTPLTLVEDFTINGDILTINGMEIDINEIIVNYEIQ